MLRHWIEKAWAEIRAFLLEVDVSGFANGVSALGRTFTESRTLSVVALLRPRCTRSTGDWGFGVP